MCAWLFDRFLCVCVSTCVCIWDSVELWRTSVCDGWMILRVCVCAWTCVGVCGCDERQWLSNKNQLHTHHTAHTYAHTNLYIYTHTHTYDEYQIKNFMWRSFGLHRHRHTHTHTRGHTHTRKTPYQDANIIKLSCTTHTHPHTRAIIHWYMHESTDNEESAKACREVHFLRRPLIDGYISICAQRRLRITPTSDLIWYTHARRHRQWSDHPHCGHDQLLWCIYGCLTVCDMIRMISCAFHVVIFLPSNAVRFVIRFINNKNQLQVLLLHCNDTNPNALRLILII